MTWELAAFLVLIALHLRWAYRESEAEKQRDEIRINLLATLDGIVAVLGEIKPGVEGLANRLNAHIAEQSGKTD